MATTYTDQELLDLARQCLADIFAGGQAKTIRGKTLTYADISKVRAEISSLENRISAKSQTGGGIVHIQHARR